MRRSASGGKILVTRRKPKADLTSQQNSCHFSIISRALRHGNGHCTLCTIYRHLRPGRSFFSMGTARGRTSQSPHLPHCTASISNNFETGSIDLCSQRTRHQQPLQSRDLEDTTLFEQLRTERLQPIAIEYWHIWKEEEDWLRDLQDDRY
jgi:hypothetical protein